jgi:formate hydrogenlyase subunit 3/multisubunit Na+/H+ antiporter MnhD subunit
MVVNMDAGTILLFMAPLTTILVLAFTFFSRRDTALRMLCAIVQMFAVGILISMQQYLFATGQEPFIANLAAWTAIFGIVLVLAEFIVMFIESL